MSKKCINTNEVKLFEGHEPVLFFN